MRKPTNTFSTLTVPHKVLGSEQERDSCDRSSEASFPGSIATRFLPLSLVIVRGVSLCCRNPSLSADGTWATTYWPRHTADKREVLELNANYTRTLNGLRVKKCAFWNKFLPKLLSSGKCLRTFVETICSNHLQMFAMSS